MVRQQADFGQSIHGRAYREQHLFSDLYRFWRQCKHLDDRHGVGYAATAPGSHGVAGGEPDVGRGGWVFHAHLVVDQCELLCRFRLMVGQQDNLRQSINRRDHREPQLLSDLYRFGR